MRADRLLSILYTLQEGRSMTVGALARRLEVSERTVARDLEALTAAGVPVYAARGRHGGVRLLAPLAPPTVDLSAEQLSLLLSAGAPLSDLGLGPERQLAAQKVLQAAPAAGREAARALGQRLLVDHHSWSPVREGAPHLGLLFEAVRRDQPLRLDYPSRGEGPRPRRVEPYALVMKGATWYLIARETGTYKTLRVSRVERPQPDGAPFARDPTFDLERHWAGAVQRFEAGPATPVTLSLLAEWDAVEALSRFAQRQQAEPGPDGLAQVSVTFGDAEIALSRVLMLGGRVRLLGPPALLARLKEHLSQLQAVYGPDEAALDQS